MRKLKRVPKKPYIFEAGFIYCKRRGIEYNADKFVNEIFMTDEFHSEENSEFDKIEEDLRCYRFKDSYQLKEITDEEYEMCIDKFGEQV